eukprot:8787680-Pyramimonas_sp.AAC.1
MLFRQPMLMWRSSLKRPISLWPSRALVLEARLVSLARGMANSSKDLKSSLWSSVRPSPSPWVIWVSSWQPRSTLRGPLLGAQLN